MRININPLFNSRNYLCCYTKIIQTNQIWAFRRAWCAIFKLLNIYDWDFYPTLIYRLMLGRLIFKWDIQVFLECSDLNDLFFWDVFFFVFTVWAMFRLLPHYTTFTAFSNVLFLMQYEGLEFIFLCFYFYLIIFTGMVWHKSKSPKHSQWHF